MLQSGAESVKTTESQEGIEDNLDIDKEHYLQMQNQLSEMKYRLKHNLDQLKDTKDRICTSIDRIEKPDLYPRKPKCISRIEPEKDTYMLSAKTVKFRKFMSKEKASESSASNPYQFAQKLSPKESISTTVRKYESPNVSQNHGRSQRLDPQMARRNVISTSYVAGYSSQLAPSRTAYEAPRTSTLPSNNRSISREKITQSSQLNFTHEDGKKKLGTLLSQFRTNAAHLHRNLNNASDLLKTYDLKRKYSEMNPYEGLSASNSLQYVPKPSLENTPRKSMGRPSSNWRKDMKEVQDNWRKQNVLESCRERLNKIKSSHKKEEIVREELTKSGVKLFSIGGAGGIHDMKQHGSPQKTMQNNNIVTLTTFHIN